LTTPIDYKSRAPAYAPVAILGRGDDSVIVDIIMALRGDREVASAGRIAGDRVAGTLSLPDPDNKIVKAVADLAVYVDPGVPLHYLAIVSKR
jgi:hypothetical protein